MFRTTEISVAIHKKGQLIPLSLEGKYLSGELWVIFRRQRFGVAVRHGTKKDLNLSFNFQRYVYISSFHAVCHPQLVRYVGFGEK